MVGATGFPGTPPTGVPDGSFGACASLRSRPRSNELGTSVWRTTGRGLISGENEWSGRLDFPDCLRPAIGTAPSGPPLPAVAEDLERARNQRLADDTSRFDFRRKKNGRGDWI